MTVSRGGRGEGGRRGGRRCEASKTRTPHVWKTLGFTLLPSNRVGLLPGRKSGFRARFRPEPNLESLKIDPPAGLRQPGVEIVMLSR